MINKDIYDKFYNELKKRDKPGDFKTDEKEEIKFMIKKFIEINSILINIKKEKPIDIEKYFTYRTLIEYVRMTIYYYSLPFIFIPFNHKRNPVTIFLTRYNYDNVYIDSMTKLDKYKENYQYFQNKLLENCNRSIDGLKRGFSPSRRTIIFMITQLDNIIINNYLKVNVSDEYKTIYRKFYDETVIKFVNNYKTFLNGYKNYCRETIGINLVCKYSTIGNDMYKYLLKKHLTIDMSAEKIHMIGIEEVKKITENMIKIKERMGYSRMDIREFYKKKIYKTFNNGDEIVNYFKLLSNENKSVIDKYFYKDIKKKCIIKKIPNYRNLAQIAYYTNTTCVFSINDNTELLPTCICKSLSLHENSPGHHYQFQYMKENGISKFLIENNRNTAFIEGWGLYVETLGDYNDVELFGKYMEEKLRAIRLVIDTGIHYYGWSYEKALEYFTQNSLLPIDKLKKELERYIAQPAQAIGYKIGELFFLRKQREWMKSGLDIKLFHKVILEGGILSLDDVERNINRFIKNKM